MKAVVFHGIGDIRLDEVPAPAIQEPNDAIVRLTATSVCGTDLHMVRGTMPGMEPGTILGHEGVGIVEEVGPRVKNVKPGDRVVIASTIACGYCSYCRAGYFSQCDNANPNGPRAGTAFFGGPKASGPFHGLQAETARIPFANVGLVKLPDDVADEDGLMLSDIFPTGYFGADLAEIKPGDTVAVFGCGPVGQFAILSAFLHDAGRVIAVDAVPSRLDMARAQGAEVINFEEEHPVSTILDLTGGIGVDRVIDAVGVDAESAHRGPAAAEAERQAAEGTGKWQPGDAPSQALLWAVNAVDKAGTLAVIGVYPQEFRTFPFGVAMNKNLTINMGNCHHRRYMPMLLEMVRSGAVVPSQVLTAVEPLTGVLDAYKAFDQRQPGWMKVELVPEREAVEA
ncbi:MAG: glutathione-dependent formaldehyde dehydrogenase [Desulfobacteraceae bacterium]|nr:glutathione-dependent formaldehyde dehydrogenase [Desulfobacteraceae bacterium]